MRKHGKRRRQKKSPGTVVAVTELVFAVLVVTKALERLHHLGLI